MENRAWRFFELMFALFWFVGFGLACQPAAMPAPGWAVSVTWTPAVEPAVTLVPSSTPVPSTVSTATGTPAAAPTGRLSPGVERYLADVTASGNRLSRALQGLAELLQAARLADTDWEQAIRGQVATISQLQQDLRRLDVPVELIGIHSDLLSALHECDVVASFLSYPTINSSDVAVASEQLILCRAAFSGRLQTLGERARKSE
jgi:hypothetical protein